MFVMEKIPSRIYAERWDGTTEAARKIKDLIWEKTSMRTDKAAISLEKSNLYMWLNKKSGGEAGVLTIPKSQWLTVPATEGAPGFDGIAVMSHSKLCRIYRESMVTAESFDAPPAEEPNADE